MPDSIINFLGGFLKLIFAHLKLIFQKALLSTVTCKFCSWKGRGSQCRVKVEFCNRDAEIGTKETCREMPVGKSTRRSTRARLRRMASIGKEDHESQPTAPRTLLPAVKLRMVVFITSHRPALQ